MPDLKSTFHIILWFHQSQLTWPGFIQLGSFISQGDDN